MPESTVPMRDCCAGGAVRATGGVIFRANGSSFMAGDCGRTPLWWRDTVSAPAFVIVEPPLALWQTMTAMLGFFIYSIPPVDCPVPWVCKLLCICILGKRNQY